MIALRHMGGGQFKALYPGKCANIEVGEVAAYERIEHRSPDSHRQFFAAVHDSWANLPEALADDFPSSDHLRKFALIKAGYCDMTKIVCKSNADAMTCAMAMKGMDTYMLVDVFGAILTVYRAKSQSIPKMGKAAFEESKDKVFAVISQLIGADSSKAGMAA